MLIRPATFADAAALVPLLEALGYPAPADAIRARLGALAEYAGPATVLVASAPVAAGPDAPLGGLVTAHAFPSINAEAPAAWLTTLVVVPAAQGRGLGRRLVEAAEAWAFAQGAVRISVSSGLARAGAHAFYARLGYVPSGQRFTRTLTPPSGAA